MPHFHYNMNFTAQFGDGDQTIEGGLETKFEKMAGLLQEFVGQDVDARVNMIGTPRLNQFKMMVDVTPFKKKDWHFTAGFFAGKSRIARAINADYEISTLMAVNMYNRMHDNAGTVISWNGASVSLPPEFMHYLDEYGKVGFPLGQYTKDIFYDNDVPDIDPETGEQYIDEDTGEPIFLHTKGELMHAKGETYMMTPTKENTAFANMFVNKFRPYLGFGYYGAIDKKKTWRLGFDAGIMMWGGSPTIIDNNGMDLMRDVKNIKGDVGNYVRIARRTKVFPLVELKFVHTLF